MLYDSMNFKTLLKSFLVSSIFSLNIFPLYFICFKVLANFNYESIITGLPLNINLFFCLIYIQVFIFFYVISKIFE